MPGHDDEGVRDRDGGLPAARFAEPAVHAAELGADAGAGAACRPGAFGEDDADLGASLLARPDLCLPADSLLRDTTGTADRSPKSAQAPGVSCPI